MTGGIPMIFIRCIKDVFKESEYDYIDYTTKVCLFKEGNFYMANENEDGQWMAADEEDFPHIVADGEEYLNEDVWFHEHFQLA